MGDSSALGCLITFREVNGNEYFNRVYGSLGAVIVLLLWIFLTAYTVLLGAEINRELERWAGVEKPQS